MAKVTLRRDTYLRLRGIKREFNLKSTNEALDMVVETAAKSLKQDPLQSDRVLTPEELKDRAAATKKALRDAKVKRKRRDAATERERVKTAERQEQEAADVAALKELEREEAEAEAAERADLFTPTDDGG